MGWLCVCRGRGEPAGLQKACAGAQSVAIRLLCQPGLSLIKAESKLCKKPTAGKCDKVEALKTSIWKINRDSIFITSTLNNSIQNQRSPCEHIKFLEQLDTKLLRCYLKAKREIMPFPEAEQDIKDWESGAEIKGLVMLSGQMFWHPIKGTKLEV